MHQSFTITAVRILTSLCLISTTNLAFGFGYKNEAKYKGEDACITCPHLGSAPYIGLQIGYDSYRVRDKLFRSLPINVQHTAIINATGPVGGLLLGFGYFIRNFYYIGAEVFGNYSGADTRINTIVNFPTINYFFKIRTRSSWGVALLPGIKLADTALFYIRLGANWANFKAEEVGNLLGSNFYNTKTHTGSGFNFGFGIETLIDGPWSLRGEYTHTAYSSFRMPTKVTMNHPSDNQVMLAGLYRFCI